LRFTDIITNEINETTTETTNTNNHDLPLNLADVLLNDHIMVFEPLWTLIPSNKAILPVLWRMFPNHSYLLNADYTLNDELKDNGCGANIQLVSSDSKTLAEKTGFFDDRPMIYQQLFTLPNIDKQYVQISTFTAQGHYAGCGVRVDSSMIIGKDSDCLPLQIAFE
jgi:glutathionylspermidine amidase/synthetase